MAWTDKAKAGAGATEGVITDYSFMDTFPFGDGDKDDDNDNIYMLLEVTPDGADEPNKRSLYLGSGQYLKITDKGKSLESSDEDGTPRLYDQGEVFKFIESLEAAGFPAEARFPDPSEGKINFEAMIGTRIRVTNEIDEEATKKFGKRKVTKGKHKGKEFNRTYTKVTKVFEVADEAPAKSKATNAKASKAAAKDDDGDDDETPTVTKKQLDKFIVAVIEAQPKSSVEKSGLALAITRYAAKQKMDNGERDALRNAIIADEFAYIDDAVEREVLAATKKGVLTVAE